MPEKPFQTIPFFPAVIFAAILTGLLCSCNTSPKGDPPAGVFPAGVENASLRGGIVGLGESNGVGGAVEATGANGFGFGVSLKVYPVSPFSGELPKGPVPSGHDYGQHETFTIEEVNDEAMAAAIAANPVGAKPFPIPDDQ